MLRIKKVLMVLVLLLFILTIGVVSASENMTDGIVLDDQSSFQELMMLR